MCVCVGLCVREGGKGCLQLCEALINIFMAIKSHTEAQYEAVCKQSESQSRLSYLSTDQIRITHKCFPQMSE